MDGRSLGMAMRMPMIYQHIAPCSVFVCVCYLRRNTRSPCLTRLLGPPPSLDEACPKAARDPVASSTAV